MIFKDRSFNRFTLTITPKKVKALDKKTGA